MWGRILDFGLPIEGVDRSWLKPVPNKPKNEGTEEHVQEILPEKHEISLLTVS